MTTSAQAIPRRLIAIALFVAVVLALPFLFWGGWFETAFSQERMARWLAESRSWAWLAAIGLLIGDLFLPIPATGVMAALGSTYGVVLGAIIAAAGSCLSGALGYGLCRLLGERAARRLCKPDELATLERFFAQWGAWAVIVSRMMPLLSETAACLAGLARMPARVFGAALVAGTLPVCVLFAAIGSLSREAPAWGTIAAVLLPLAAWPIVRRWAASDRKREAMHDPSGAPQ